MVTTEKRAFITLILSTIPSTRFYTALNGYQNNLLLLQQAEHLHHSVKSWKDLTTVVVLFGDLGFACPCVVVVPRLTADGCVLRYARGKSSKGVALFWRRWCMDSCMENTKVAAFWSQRAVRRNMHMTFLL